MLGVTFKMLGGKSDIFASQACRGIEFGVVFLLNINAPPKIQHVLLRLRLPT